MKYSQIQTSICQTISFCGSMYKKLGRGKVNYLKKDTIDKAQDDWSVG